MTQPYPPQSMPPPPPRRGMPGWQKALIAIGAVFALLVFIGIVGLATEDSAPDDTKSAVPKETPKTEAPEKKSADESASEDEKDRKKPEEKPAEEKPEEEAADSATLPNLVGQQLQAAQDTAQDAGFFALTSHDESGQERFQVYDRNWVVCSQNPAPGKHPVDTEVDFGAVKTGETCP